MSDKQEQLLQEIKSSVDELTRKVDKQEGRIDHLEEKMGTQKEASPSETPPPPPPPSSEEEEFFKDQIRKETPSPSEKKPETNWEEKLGAQWFAKIGIAVLIIGIALFLKYAFDNDWIGETGRVIIGLVAGLALLAWGEKLIKKYFVYAQLITGGGLAILYLSIFAALNFYHLIPNFLAFGAMIVVTTVGVLLSLRYNAPYLLGATVIGGFATPFLVSSGENQQIVLFFYVLLLDLAILAVSVFKKWRFANLLGFFGTIITAAAWLGEFYTKEQLFSTVFFFTLFFLVYSLSSLIYNLANKEESTGFEQVVTLLAGFVYFSVVYSLMNPDYHSFMGFFALVLAVYYFLWAYLVRSLTPKDEKLYYFLALLTVGFITLAVFIQFDSYVVTLAWAVEAVLIFYLAFKSNDKGIGVFGAVVAALTLLRTLFVNADINLPEKAMVFLNERFLVYVFVVIAFYIIAHLAHIMKPKEGETAIFDHKKIVLVFLVVANFLTLFAVSQEVIGHYDKKIDRVQEQRQEIQEEHNRKLGKTESFYQTEANQEIRQKIQNLDYQKSITLSIFWLIYAIILLVLGFARKYRPVRIGGIILLVLAILKLFFVDLWNLGSLYRIVSSITLGAVLLGISFAYNKYKDKVKEII